MKIMNKLLIVIMISAFFTACGNPGDTKLVSPVNDSKIEVYRYYLGEGEFVYLARFKDTPNVITTNWRVNKSIQSAIVIYENDSIIISKKQ